MRAPDDAGKVEGQRRRFVLGQWIHQGGFVAGDQMHFALVSRYPFNDDRCLDQARNLRAMDPPAGMHFQLGGSPAVLVDLKACLRDRAPSMILVVVIAMFLVLFLMFGSITLSRRGPSCGWYSPA